MFPTTHTFGTITIDLLSYYLEFAFSSLRWLWLQVECLEPQTL